MPRENAVLCAHCGQYLPRKREREHRRLAIAPVVSSPVRQSRLRRVFDIESDSDDDKLPGQEILAVEEAVNGDATIDGAGEVDVGHWDGLDDELSNFVGGNEGLDGYVKSTLHQRWKNAASCLDSETDSDTDTEPPYPRLEDSDDESDDGFIDWKAIEEGNSLSAWDQLGESYEMEAASIGVFFVIKLYVSI